MKNERSEKYDEEADYSCAGDAADAGRLGARRSAAGAAGNGVVAGDGRGVRRHQPWHGCNVAVLPEARRKENSVENRTGSDCRADADDSCAAICPD